ncbi:hypothetical protein Esti_006541 [Eimeria stiedai]
MSSPGNPGLHILFSAGPEERVPLGSLSPRSRNSEEGMWEEKLRAEQKPREPQDASLKRNSRGDDRRYRDNHDRKRSLRREPGGFYSKKWMCTIRRMVGGTGDSTQAVLRDMEDPPTGVQLVAECRANQAHFLEDNGTELLIMAKILEEEGVYSERGYLLSTLLILTKPVLGDFMVLLHSQNYLPKDRLFMAARQYLCLAIIHLASNLHNMGLVHYSRTPDNILLSQDGTIDLSEFTRSYFCILKPRVCHNIVHGDFVALEETKAPQPLAGLVRILASYSARALIASDARSNSSEASAAAASQVVPLSSHVRALNGLVARQRVRTELVEQQQRASTEAQAAARATEKRASGHQRAAPVNRHGDWCSASKFAQQLLQVACSSSSSSGKSLHSRSRREFAGAARVPVQVFLDFFFYNVFSQTPINFEPKHLPHLRSC